MMLCSILYKMVILQRVHMDLMLYLCCRVIDVAGQMNQRKKWIHFFESVTAVFFFASLTGYCEMLEEDTTLVSYHLIPKRCISPVNLSPK